MITQEQYLELEAKIRKDLPRLLEPTVGCKLTLLYQDGKGEDTTIIENNDSWCKLLFSNRVDFYDKDIVDKSIIIGHDIILSDVLEWLSKTPKNFRKVLIDDDGFIYKFTMGGVIELIENFKWDLSKIYLKDQSEELIDFLYNLI